MSWGETRSAGRRAVRVFAWIAGGLMLALVALIVLALVASTHESRSSHTIFDQPAIITQAQYDAAAIGSDEATLEGRFDSLGIPENTLSLSLERDFPSHPDDIGCSFWKIKGRPRALARLCFTSPEARLASKRERSVAG